jgi:hypothetical protein
MKLAIQRKCVLQSDRTSVKNIKDRHIQLATLTPLAEGLDVKLLLTVKMEKILIRLVCIRGLAVPVLRRQSCSPSKMLKRSKPSSCCPLE